MSLEKSSSVPGLEPTSKEDGNSSEISAAGSLHVFLQGLHKTFGPIASFWWRKMYTVSIASADLFEEQQDIFDRPIEPFMIFEPIFEPRSVGFANKEDAHSRWHHYIKALTEDAVKGYIPQIQEVADEILDKLMKLPEKSKVPLTEYTSVYALKVYLHTLYGNLMKDDNDELHFRSEIDQVWAEVKLSMVKPRTEELTKHIQEEKKDIKELIQNMIKDRKAAPPKEGEETLLDLFISFTDNEELQLADAMEFAASAQITIEYLMTCAIFYIATNPAVDKKLYDEIQAVLAGKDVNGDNIGNLVYVRQMIDETLRCSPIVTYAARYQGMDSKLGGYEIPKNTPVIHALGVAAKDEKVWPNPDKFDPERFSKENQQTRSPFCFTAFGTGKRKCVAHHFPYAAATVGLVTLLKKFKVHLVDENQKLSPVYGLATHQKEEILIFLSSR